MNGTDPVNHNWIKALDGAYSPARWYCCVCGAESNDAGFPPAGGCKLRPPHPLPDGWIACSQAPASRCRKKCGG